jgi:hypothetical protein
MGTCFFKQTSIRVISWSEYRNTFYHGWWLQTYKKGRYVIKTIRNMLNDDVSKLVDNNEIEKAV